MIPNGNGGGFEVDINLVIAFGLGLLLLYLLGRVMMVPLKLIFKLLINAVAGGILLLVINYFGSFLNMHIPFNPITALVAGFLGIPGVIMLFVLQQIIVK